jgi:hypothetical protein
MKNPSCFIDLVELATTSMKKWERIIVGVLNAEGESIPSGSWTFLGG